MERPCNGCGATFDAPRKRGAPRRFCDECAKERGARSFSPEQLAKKREYQRAYAETARGRAVTFVRVTSKAFKEKREAAQRAYRATPEYKAKQDAYTTSPAGMEAQARFRATDGGRVYVRRTSALRRSREAALPATLSQAEWLEILGAFENRCAYCRGNGPLQIEHVVPCARSGGLTASNVVPACEPCNQSKGTRDVDEWMLERGFDLEALEARRRVASGISGFCVSE